MSNKSKYQQILDFFSNEDVTKMSEVALADGTLISVDKMEVGGKVQVKDAEGNFVDSTGGQYPLEDGSVLIVAEDGLISEIKTAEMMKAEGEKTGLEEMNKKIEELEKVIVGMFGKIELLEGEKKELSENLSKTKEKEDEVKVELSKIKEQTEALKATIPASATEMVQLKKTEAPVDGKAPLKGGKYASMVENVMNK